jgi:hypothetical protein
VVRFSLTQSPLVAGSLGLAVRPFVVVAHKGRYGILSKLPTDPSFTAANASDDEANGKFLNCTGVKRRCSFAIQRQQSIDIEVAAASLVEISGKRDEPFLQRSQLSKWLAVSALPRTGLLSCKRLLRSVAKTKHQNATGRLIDGVEKQAVVYNKRSHFKIEPFVLWCILTAVRKRFQCLQRTPSFLIPSLGG